MRVIGPGACFAAAPRPEAGWAASGLPFPAPSPAAAGPAPTLAALGPAVLASLDAVLALQASPDATARRRQALRRGDALLDRLEELRVALLEGSLPVATLQELRRALARPGDGCDDPALAAVVGEIELRVAVELAKLERACRAG
jgi:hypothetical protein